MHRRMVAGLAVILVIGGFLLCGCDGGGGINRSGTGTLTNSDEQLVRGAVDFVTITPRRDGEISVRMHGDSFLDPYIVVRRGTAANWNYATTVMDDDDSGPGLDAHAVFYADGGTTYTIALTTYSHGTGSYSYTIQSQLDSASAAGMAAEPGDKPIEESARTLDDSASR